MGRQCRNPCGLPRCRSGPRYSQRHRPDLLAAAAIVAALVLRQAPHGQPAAADAGPTPGAGNSTHPQPRRSSERGIRSPPNTGSRPTSGRSCDPADRRRAGLSGRRRTRADRLRLRRTGGRPPAAISTENVTPGGNRLAGNALSLRQPPHTHITRPGGTGSMILDGDQSTGRSVVPPRGQPSELPLQCDRPQRPTAGAPVVHKNSGVMHLVIHRRPGLACRPYPGGYPR